MRQPNIEMQQQMEALYAENEHLTREIAILRDTIKVRILIGRSRSIACNWNALPLTEVAFHCF